LVEEAAESDEEEGSVVEKVMDEKAAGGVPVASSDLVDEKVGWHEEEEDGELR
jgi:hypothetical protein